MLIERQTSLSGNIILFCRFLRSKGYTITSTEESDALNTLQFIPPQSEDLYWSSLRAVLSKNKFQFLHFHDYYKEFVYELKKTVDNKLKDLPSEGKHSKKSKPLSLESLKSWLYNRGTEEHLQIASYSDIEVLVKKDFSSMDPEELSMVIRLLSQLAQRILRRQSRLRLISKKKKSLDLRATMSKNLKHGLEIRDIVFSKPKDKKLKLVLLCDVSRSMDLYSKFFIQMIYAFQSSYDRIETFVFSTALHRVSEILGNHDFNRAFEMISERVPEWSGGTKIGDSFASFFEDHGYSLLDRKTVVLVLSDGWDTGNPAVMKEAVKKIYKNARKLIWLNPLAGHPEFQPDVLGLKSVLPYITELVAAHNLISLKSALSKL